MYNGKIILCEAKKNKLNVFQEVNNISKPKMVEI